MMDEHIEQTYDITHYVGDDCPGGHRSEVVCTDCNGTGFVTTPGFAGPCERCEESGTYQPSESL